MAAASARSPTRPLFVESCSSHRLDGSASGSFAAVAGEWLVKVKREARHFPQLSSVIFVSRYSSSSVALTVPIGVCTLPGPVAYIPLAVSP